MIPNQHVQGIYQHSRVLQVQSRVLGQRMPELPRRHSYRLQNKVRQGLVRLQKKVKDQGGSHLVGLMVRQVIQGVVHIHNI